MRSRNANKIIVVATVVVGVMGMGAGRASAATATQVTRSGGLFSVWLEARAGASLNCSGLSDTGTRSVSASVGTTNLGAGQTFTCANGSQKLTMTYGIINTFASNRFSSATHRFSVTWTPDGRSFYTCKTWTQPSGQSGTVTSTFAQQWNYQLYTDVTTACSNVTVRASAIWSEAWSAS